MKKHETIQRGSEPIFGFSAKEARSKAGRYILTTAAIGNIPGNSAGRVSNSQTDSRPNAVGYALAAYFRVNGKPRRKCITMEDYLSSVQELSGYGAFMRHEADEFFRRHPLPAGSIAFYLMAVVLFFMARVFGAAAGAAIGLADGTGGVSLVIFFPCLVIATSYYVAATGSCFLGSLLGGIWVMRKLGLKPPIDWPPLRAGYGRAT